MMGWLLKLQQKDTVGDPWIFLPRTKMKKKTLWLIIGGTAIVSSFLGMVFIITVALLIPGDDESSAANNSSDEDKTIPEPMKNGGNNSDYDGVGGGYDPLDDNSDSPFIPSPPAPNDVDFTVFDIGPQDIWELKNDFDWPSELIFTPDKLIPVDWGNWPDPEGQGKTFMAIHDSQNRKYTVFVCTVDNHCLLARGTDLYPRKYLTSDGREQVYKMMVDWAYDNDLSLSFIEDNEICTIITPRGFLKDSDGNLAPNCAPI